MAHDSLAGRVLETLAALAAEATSGSVCVDDISHALTVQTTKAHKQMLNALSDLHKAGRVVRVRQGLYALPKQGREPDRREVMWRVLRMRRRVIVEDLMEMAGVSRDYAVEWLQMLTRQGVVRKTYQGGASNPRLWQLVNDTVEMPVNEAKAAKLRDLRKKKKQQAMADLLAARELIGKATIAINELED